MFTDNFTRADGNLVDGVTWTNAGGTDVTALQIVTNTVQHVSTGTLVAKCPDQGSADHYSQCVIGHLAQTWGMMLTVRMTDLNNFWGVYVNNGDGGFALYNRTVGTFAKIGSFSVTAADGDVIYIEAVGNDITAKYNGVTRVTVNNAFNNSETRQGIVAFAAAGSDEFLDNFVADALGAVQIAAVPLLGQACL